MSKLVTFEQAKKLKELRFNVPTLDYYPLYFQLSKSMYSLIPNGFAPRLTDTI